jgi:hypothetical protein
MANRTPVFELHIRPMFRELDRMHMISIRNDLDLWDYDSVRKLSTPPPAPRGRIPSRLASDMPVTNTGGPWPQEWIDLFNRWVDAGYPRLSLATAKTITATKSPGATPGTVDLMIEVTGDLPTGQLYRVWVDYEFNRKTPFEFVVYQEAGGGSSSGSFDYASDPPFPALDTLQKITVRDAHGLHDVTIT